jgi:hypothetical protein
MTGSEKDEGTDTARDAPFWAQYVERLEVGEVPEGAVNRNVDGRRVTSPIQGFGKLWQKTYELPLVGSDATPEEVIRVWKDRFGEFWPGQNRFYGSLTGIAPGDVAVLNLRVGGMRMSTGVLVLYADDVSFTVMTPQGHQFAGFNTFSAERVDGVTVARIHALIRASDPIYELGMPVVGHRMEDRFWAGTLEALAAHFGVRDRKVDMRRVCLDNRRQWRFWTNVWHNAAIRSMGYLAGTPFRLLRGGAPSKSEST